MIGEGQRGERQKGVIGEGQRGEEAEGSDWGRTEGRGREGMEIRSILPTKIL